jgi:predicted DNA-binding transcriptional regulator
MVSKDQSIGGLILLICLVVGILYVALLFFPGVLGAIGVQAADADVRFWVIAVPVFIAFIAIMAIGGWIGWTMATTPPPKPIEDITSEIEEKKEETATETQPEETKPAEEPSEEAKPAEEKKPERKRKS